jgi:hypothetical protein
VNKSIVGMAGAVIACVSLLTAVVVARGMKSEIGREPDRDAARSGKRTPVLVELFTSEGCSSCPSADQALAQLQKDQPIANVEIIPLSEHVDYWNYIGWTDPFSSSAFSERQRGYARAFRLDSTYTPQMVVNGQAEFVGSDRSRAESAIVKAASAAHANVQIKVVTNTATSADLQVRVDDLPGVRQGDNANVLLAITEDNLRSNVARGENSGRRLTHTAVVRQLRVIGTAQTSHPFNASATASLDGVWKRNDLSAVVFVQERTSGRVLGAGIVSLNSKTRE